MVEVDRVMEEELGIGLIQMMESAGRGLGRLAVGRFLGDEPNGKEILVLAGKGGNGGGALVAARRLVGWGGRVRVRLAEEAGGLDPVPSAQLNRLIRMGVPIEYPASGIPSPLPSLPSVVLDGLVGYGLSGSPRGEVAGLIQWCNETDAPVLSLDVPSGLDATSGEPLDPTVKAVATFTLALPKTGLLEESAREWVGELYLGDIGVPPEVYERFSCNVRGLFGNGEILSLSGNTKDKCHVRLG
jgi:NAD(P)H-hydrate epimerase